MIGRRRGAAGALLVAIWLSTPSLLAQPEESDDTAEADGDGGPSPQDRALAEALFREGKQLGEAGEISKACKKFKESQRLDPAVGTLLHLAACYAEDGKTASAWAAFNSAAELAQRAKQKDRETLARARAGELEKQLSRLSITVTSAAEGQTVELDGQTLGEEALSTALPVDPGPHVLVAKAPGKKSWRQSIEVAAGPSSQSVEVPALEDAPVDAPPEPEPEPEPAPAPAPPRSDGSGQRTLAYVVGGVGAVSLGVGSYFGLRAASRASEADESCRGKICTQSGLDKHADARTSATLSNVFFGVGLVGLGASIYLWLSADPGEARGAAPARSSAFWIDAGPGQVSAGGRF